MTDVRLLPNIEYDQACLRADLVESYVLLQLSAQT